MPRTTITSLFGTSPVKPLQHDWTRAREQQEKISRLEQEADALKRELRLNLSRSLLMPASPPWT